MKKGLIFIGILLISLSFLNHIYASPTQETYVLDIMNDSNNATFRFYENALNDSSTAKNLTFNGNENKTVYIRIPKNSSILNATLNLTGFEKVVNTLIPKTVHVQDNNEELCCRKTPPGNSMRLKITAWAGENVTFLNLRANGTTPGSLLEHLTPTKVGDEAYAVTTSEYSNSTQYFFCAEVTVNTYIWKTVSSNCISPNGGQVYRAGGWNFGDPVALNISNHSYPHDTWIKVADNDTNSWNKSGILDSPQSAQLNTTQINNWFKNVCSSDSNGFCNLPIKIHSDKSGFIQIYNINTTYHYNISEKVLVNYPFWESKPLFNIIENKSYNVTRQINFTSNPSLNISIKYISINSSATACRLNGTTYPNTTSQGINVCNVTDLNIWINDSGTLSKDWRLWDNNMTTGIPANKTETNTIFIWLDPSQAEWRKNVSIFGWLANSSEDADGDLINVTFNTTFNGSKIKNNEFIRIWNGSWQNGNPSSFQTDCNTNSPTYSNFTIGSKIWRVCKQDTDSDTYMDFIKILVPTLSNQKVQVGGTYYAGGTGGTGGGVGGGPITIYYKTGIKIDPEKLTFDIPTGIIISKDIEVCFEGSSDLATFKSSIVWLVAPNGANINKGECKKFTVKVNSVNMVKGKFNATLEIIKGGDLAANIPVNLIVRGELDLAGMLAGDPDLKNMVILAGILAIIYFGRKKGKRGSWTV